MQILRISGILVFLLLAANVQGKLYHASKANHVGLSAASSWTLYPGLDLTKTFSKPQTVLVFYQITGGNHAEFSSMLRVNGDPVSTSTATNERYRNLVGFWTKVVPPGTYRFQVFYKSTASLLSLDTDWTSNIIRVFWMDYLETTSASSHLTCEQQLNTDNFWRSLDSTTTTLLVPEQRAVLAFYTSSFAFPSTVSGEMFTQLEVDGFPDVSSTCSKGLITETNLFGGYAGMMKAGLHQFRLRTRASHDMETHFCGTPFGQNLAAVVLPQGCEVDKVCPDSSFILTTGDRWTDVPDMGYSLHLLRSTAMYQYSGNSSDAYIVLRLVLNGTPQLHTPSLTGQTKYTGDFNLWYSRLSTGHHYFNIQLRMRNPAKTIHNPNEWESRCLTIIHCPA